MPWMEKETLLPGTRAPGPSRQRGADAMRTGGLGSSPWQRPQEVNVHWGDAWILEAITKNQDLAGDGGRGSPYPSHSSTEPL